MRHFNTTTLSHLNAFARGSGYACVLALAITASAQAQKSPSAAPNAAPSAAIELPPLPPLQLTAATSLSYIRAGELAGITAVRRAELADTVAQKEILAAKLEMAKMQGVSPIGSPLSPTVRAIVSKPDGSLRAQITFGGGQQAWFGIGMKLPSGALITEMSGQTVSITNNGRDQQVLQHTFAPVRQGSITPAVGGLAASRLTQAATQ